MLERALSFLVNLLQDFRRVRFRAHAAFFRGGTEEQVFLTVTNLSRNREIEVTHVWLAASPEVSALPSERPLPKRLRPDEIWETWIPLGKVPLSHQPRVLKLGRLQLSTGRIVRSRPDHTGPNEGFIPGGSREKV